MVLAEFRDPMVKFGENGKRTVMSNRTMYSVYSNRKAGDLLVFGVSLALVV